MCFIRAIEFFYLLTIFLETFFWCSYKLASIGCVRCDRYKNKMWKLGKEVTKFKNVIKRSYEESIKV